MYLYPAMRWNVSSYFSYSRKQVNFESNYHPRKRLGNVLGRVWVPVRLSVNTIAFEPLYIPTSFLVWFLSMLYLGQAWVPRPLGQCQSQCHERKKIITIFLWLVLTGTGEGMAPLAPPIQKYVGIFENFVFQYTDPTKSKIHMFHIKLKIIKPIKILLTTFWTGFPGFVAISIKYYLKFTLCWLNSGKPQLVVSYEKLQQNLKTEMRKIVKFLGQPVSDKVLDCVEMNY